MDAIVEAIVGQNLEALRRSLRPGVNLNYISAGGAPIHWAALVRRMGGAKRYPSIAT